MKRRRVALSLAVVASAMLTSAVAPAQPQPRGVIELFTSQGCSSCPPADKLAGELARDPSLVVLTLPVDYWDYLGWKDTLAMPGHTKRQRAYSKARSDREVYTPQVVVNGAKQVLGSDRQAIDSAIANTRKQAGMLSLPVSVSITAEQISISVPAVRETSNGEIWLCPITKAAEVAIGRGENSGQTVTYHNVVRSWVKLGEWTGAARTFKLPRQDVGSADAVAVLVQSGSKEAPGNMLGATIASLR